MGELGPNQLDQRLLKAGYVVAAIGYGVLLIGVLLPGLAWITAHERDDAAVAMGWVLSFGMLGAALINCGRRLRRAYRAGMQSGV
ncbi:hypothetical protein [Novosphingobium sp.]|uniref:hypothetical protein n=1 Tax=Novosphingobium sp. TaxID=1874826 RepID=UPI0028A8DA86|nr:hypothetical protein [Novosphingobium sp.]